MNSNSHLTPSPVEQPYQLTVEEIHDEHNEVVGMRISNGTDTIIKIFHKLFWKEDWDRLERS